MHDDFSAYARLSKWEESGISLLNSEEEEVVSAPELLSLHAFLGDGKYLESESEAPFIGLPTYISVNHDRSVEGYLH